VIEDAERLTTAWNERQARRMPLLFRYYGANATSGLTATLLDDRFRETNQLPPLDCFGPAGLAMTAEVRHCEARSETSAQQEYDSNFGNAELDSPHGRTPHRYRPSEPSGPKISGHVHDLERKLARHRASLANIDATIRLFAFVSREGKRKGVRYVAVARVNNGPPLTGQQRPWSSWSSSTKFLIF
jgi:hypothetical protein